MGKKFDNFSEAVGGFQKHFFRIESPGIFMQQSAHRGLRTVRGAVHCFKYLAVDAFNTIADKKQRQKKQHTYHGDEIKGK